MKRILQTILLFAVILASGFECTAQLGDYYRNIEKLNANHIVYKKEHLIIKEYDTFTKAMFFKNGVCSSISIIFHEEKYQTKEGVKSIVDGLPKYKKAIYEDGWVSTTTINDKTYNTYLYITWEETYKQYIAVHMVPSMYGLIMK